MRDPNKKGCIPNGDVCLKHCLPLVCRHGCPGGLKHTCREYDNNLQEYKRFYPDVKWKEQTER